MSSFLAWSKFWSNKLWLVFTGMKQNNFSFLEKKIRMAGSKQLRFQSDQKRKKSADMFIFCIKSSHFAWKWQLIFSFYWLLWPKNEKQKNGTNSTNLWEINWPIRMSHCRIPATDGAEFWISCNTITYKSRLTQKKLHKKTDAIFSIYG